MPRPKSLFTPTEQRMLNILNDGFRHSKKELATCLDDELTEAKTILWHLFNLRRKLKPKGLGVLIEKDKGSTYYRQVRFLDTGD